MVSSTGKMNHSVVSECLVFTEFFVSFDVIKDQEMAVIPNLAKSTEITE